MTGDMLAGVLARPLRIESPLATHHVTARGNQARALFAGDRDRWRWAEPLVESPEANLGPDDPPNRPAAAHGKLEGPEQPTLSAQKGCGKGGQKVKCYGLNPFTPFTCNEK